MKTYKEIKAVKAFGYSIFKSKAIKKLLLKNGRVEDHLFMRLEAQARLLQIYNCRLFGLCFYKSDRDFQEFQRRLQRGK